MATHSVALNLAPLLAPHRKRGRLSLRLERIPQGTRLSRGTRNNDNTWSLASDELDDLALQMPAKPQQEFKIGVRVISLMDGSTLVTVDVPIKPGEEVAGVGSTLHAGMSPAEAAELNVLRKELASTKDMLAARDSELAERLAAAATDAAGLFQQTLKRAESAWTEAENARLASVQEQWQEKFGEALHELETAQTQAHEAKVRELQEKIDALQLALEHGTAALEQAKVADAAARERGNSAAQDAMAKVGDLQAKVGDLQTKLAEREADLARAIAAAEAAKRDAEAALEKAEQAWRDGEAARLAAAETNWRETSAKALSDAHANAETQRLQGHASERDLLTRVAELQAAIAERDEALARAQSASEQARARALQEADARLAKAEENWKAAQAARVAAVEAEWRTKVDEAANSVQAAPVATPVVAVDEAELQDLREKVTSLHAKLALRDAAAGRAAKLAEEERRRWQKEAQDVIVKAARERKADENARLAAAQSEWSKHSVHELAIVTARAEAAESALTQLRIRAAEEAPLQREVVSLRSALAIREAELEHYRATHPDVEDPFVTDNIEAQAPAQNPRPKRMYRDALIAACLGVAVVVLWPTMMNSNDPPPAPPKPVEAAVVAPYAPVFAIVSKDMKLRATPSIYGKFVGKLPRDTKVERLETQGEFTRVRMTDAPEQAKPTEGWAKTSLLQDPPPAPETPPAKKKK